jgi:hypothetical protein
LDTAKLFKEFLNSFVHNWFLSFWILRSTGEVLLCGSSRKHIWLSSISKRVISSTN